MMAGGRKSLQSTSSSYLLGRHREDAVLPRFGDGDLRNVPGLPLSHALLCSRDSFFKRYPADERRIDQQVAIGSLCDAYTDISVSGNNDNLWLKSKVLECRREHDRSVDTVC